MHRSPFAHLATIAVVLTALVFPLSDAVDCHLEAVNTDARLRQHILCSYDRTIRPRKQPDKPLVVSMMLAVKSFNFDDDTNTLDMSSWLAISWTDDYLQWQPADYDHIETLVESGDLLWQPELALYNSDVTTIESQFCRTASCVVSHDGTVQCVPPCRHTAHCASDYRRWPFDTQNCTLQIGAWVHDRHAVDFQLHAMHVPDEASVSQNREWRMVRATGVYDEGRFENESFPHVQFAFELERHARTHAIVLLAPAIVMVLINLSTLWLAPVCVERLALVIANVFFHFIYMQQLSWYVPSNGDVVPLIVKFFQTSLWLTVLLLAVAVGTRGLNESRARPVPAWLAAAVAYVEALRCGRFCMRQRYLVETQPLHADSADAGGDGGDDDDDLTEVQTNDPDPDKPAAAAGTKAATAVPTVADAWRIAVRLIDRLLFVVLLFVYLLMAIEWLPEGYLTARSTGTVLEIH